MNKSMIVIFLYERYLILCTRFIHKLLFTNDISSKKKTTIKLGSLETRNFKKSMS